MKIVISRMYRFDAVTGEYHPVYIKFTGYDKFGRKAQEHDLSGKVGTIYRMGEHAIELNEDVVRVDAEAVAPFTAFAWKISG